MRSNHPSTMNFRYQNDPPVNDAIASLRVKDLISLSDGDTVTAWGTSTLTSSSVPIYKNDSSFPYVDVNGGGLDLGNHDIVAASGFTYMGLVLTTEISQPFSHTFTYMNARDNGIRLQRAYIPHTDMVFNSRSPSSSPFMSAGPVDVSDTNQWQVFACRVNNNGDNTITMDFSVDNVIVATKTSPTSSFSTITTGIIEVGRSKWYASDPDTEIYISDTFFYDRALSDAEMTDMNAYFTTIGDAVAPPALILNPRVLSIGVTVAPVSGATGYRLTSKRTDSSKSTVVNTGFTDLSQKLNNLEPETEYTLSLYSTSGTTYEFVGESTVSTLANSASNYDTSDFGSDNRFDLSSLNNTSIGFVSSIMNNLFVTGDTIDINVKGTFGSKKSKFVNRGSTVSIDDSDALVAPFIEDGGSGQTISMTLSDNSTSTVDYDETNNSVTIDGDSFSTGESLVLDGKKVSVYDL